MREIQQNEQVGPRGADGCLRRIVVRTPYPK